MLHLPLYLEKKLKELFSTQRAREQFVAGLVKQALEDMETTAVAEATAKNVSIGGVLHLYSDGGSRGNPGQAAVGALLIDPTNGTVIEEVGQCIGQTTNNVAEYAALIAGLKLAIKHHPNQLVCHLDSELVVRQLNGQYKVKVPALKEFFTEIQGLVNEFTSIQFVHIPRAQNTQADALVNQALDAAGIVKYNRFA